MDLIHDVRLLDDLLKLSAVLGEVSPALEVHGDDLGDAEVLDELDGVGSAHGDLKDTIFGDELRVAEGEDDGWVGHGGTEVDEGDEDVPLEELLLPRVEVDSVSGEPDGVGATLKKTKARQTDGGSGRLVARERKREGEREGRERERCGSTHV
jgi:hypothetical protein